MTFPHIQCHQYDLIETWTVGHSGFGFLLFSLDDFDKCYEGDVEEILGVECPTPEAILSRLRRRLL